MAKFFKKINLQNTIKDAAGNPIAFTAVGDGNGVILLDEEKDAAIITALDGYADKRIGGVVRISKEIYDAQLKKKVLIPSRHQFGQLRVARQPDPFRKSPSPAGAAADVKLPPIGENEIPPKNLAQFRAQARKLSQTQKSEQP